MTDAHQELAKWLRDFAKRDRFERGCVIPDWWMKAAELVEQAREDKARLDWIEERGTFIEVGHCDIVCSREAIDEARKT